MRLKELVPVKGLMPLVVALLLITVTSCTNLNTNEIDESIPGYFGLSIDDRTSLVMENVPFETKILLKNFSEKTITINLYLLLDGRQVQFQFENEWVQTATIIVPANAIEQVPVIIQPTIPFGQYRLFAVGRGHSKDGVHILATPGLVLAHDVQLFSKTNTEHQQDVLTNPGSLSISRENTALYGVLLNNEAERLSIPDTLDVENVYLHVGNNSDHSIEYTAIVMADDIEVWATDGVLEPGTVHVFSPDHLPKDVIIYALAMITEPDGSIYLSSSHIFNAATIK